MDLQEVISTIESGAWMSLRFVTANVKKGTGGQVIELPKCKFAGRKADNSFTRLVELHQNRKIRAIHPILVTHVNNKAVV